jgi:Pyridoxamine 5'-phosphate oxidase
MKMTDHATTQSPEASSDERPCLPAWPARTIAILTTLAGDEPHAIPVSAPVRAENRRVMLSLHRTRGSLHRLRHHPRVALTILAAGNTAFTARGQAHIAQEPMTGAPDYAAIAIDVEQIDDHRLGAFEVEAGIDRRWLDERERGALGDRVRALINMHTRTHDLDAGEQSDPNSPSEVRS